MTDFATPLAEDEYFLLKLAGGYIEPEFAFTKKSHVAENWNNWSKIRPERGHMTIQRVKVSEVNT